jgi:cytochrome c553
MTSHGGTSRVYFGIAQLAFLLAAVAFAEGRSAGGYTDLRRIDSIHGEAAAGEKRATVCLACHGANGVTAGPMFPRLAGQRPAYLYHRLVSFKHAGQKDPYYSRSPMTAQVATLTDNNMRDLAIYFSQQKPQISDTGTTGPAADKGRALFLEGNPAGGIPSCQGCHGAEASGPEIREGRYAAYPSLRGQNAPYLVARLKSFRSGLPHNTTNDFIMAGVAQSLDDDSIQAVATWLSSLTPSGK